MTQQSWVDKSKQQKKILFWSCSVQHMIPCNRINHRKNSTKYPGMERPDKTQFTLCQTSAENDPLTHIDIVFPNSDEKLARPASLLDAVRSREHPVWRDQRAATVVVLVLVGQDGDLVVQSSVQEVGTNLLNHRNIASIPFLLKG